MSANKVTPATYNSDIKQIMDFYKDKSPVTGDEEYIEDVTNKESVKHYVFDGTNWDFKGSVLRADLDVEDDNVVEEAEAVEVEAVEVEAVEVEVKVKATTKKEKTKTKQVKKPTTSTTTPKPTRKSKKTASAEPSTDTTTTVVACIVPKRGSKKMVTGLSTLANLVSTGKTEKALAKIQAMMNELDSDKTKGKEKKEPSLYNKFIAENMGKFKAVDPTLTASACMKKTVELWNANKAKAVEASAVEANAVEANTVE